MASEHIKDVVCDGGTCSAVCDFCNRTHFVSSGLHMDSGELEELERNAAEKPERYVRRSDADVISYGYIEGNQYVWNCGCAKSEERLKRIEDWIWSHQKIIAAYLRKRIEAQKAAIDECADNLKAIEAQ